MNTNKTRNKILCAMFAALIAVGAFIRIPIPVVPFTLQFLFTTLAGVLLGPRYGALSVCLYLVLGLIGIPVFTEGGGLAYIFKPSFGYLIGFVFGAYIAGKFSYSNKELSLKRFMLGNFLNLAVVYLFGMVYFYMIMNMYLGKATSAWTVFLYGFILAVPGDIVLCIIAAILGKRLLPLVNTKQ